MRTATRTTRTWEFNPQNLANAGWDSAQLEGKNDELPDAGRRAAAGMIWEFTPQAPANTVWALAKLEMDDEEL